MKKCFICILLFLIAFSTQSFGQKMTDIAADASIAAQKASDTLPKSWIFGGTTLLSFGQDYCLNWSAGGDPAININGIGNLFIKYSKKKLFWENTFDINYGLQRNFTTNRNTKTNDKIEFNTKIGYFIGGHWNFGALVKFQTQINEGFQSDTILSSAFMTPAYLITSIGMEYKRKMWSFFISPITGKTTFKLDNRFYDGNYFGIPDSTKVFAAFGFFTKVAFSYNIHPKIFLNTKLELFSDYLNQPEKVDVNFQMLWNFKITKWLSTSIYVELIYDYDIKFNRYDGNGNALLDANGNNLTTDHVQFKENFGLSLTYTFKIPDSSPQKK